MSAAIPLRDDCDAHELCVLAGKVKDANQARRLLRMADELIDLTTMKPSRAGLTPTDLMWIVVVGGVPYLAREAFRYFLPRRPTVVDQLKVLAELIAAARDAQAKSLKVRISTGAKTRWNMPEQIQEAKILGENADTIDLEIVFA
jgi:hypothetical protein